MRVSVRKMEAYLRASGTPYVAVDEAKKALFAGVSLKSFDFVAYSADGPNWLITCKPFSADEGEMRRTMQQWQDVFGAGFTAAEVRLRRGRFVLVTLDGKAVELPAVDLTPAAEPPTRRRNVAVEAVPVEAALAPQDKPIEGQLNLFAMES